MYRLVVSGGLSVLKGNVYNNKRTRNTIIIMVSMDDILLSHGYGTAVVLC